MNSFISQGVTIAYEVWGEGPDVLLIHGFGSNRQVNWVETGWVEALTKAGFRVTALDNRGHGESQKLYDGSAYEPRTMAGDATGLLDHLRVQRATVTGFSMGARIAAFMALGWPDRLVCTVWGGMGMNLVTGLSDSEEIIAALLAPSLADVPGRTGRQFRIFADRTRADRRALAACMERSRQPMAAADVGRIEVPVLVAAGSEDAMAGPPQALAEMLPRGEAFVIAGRDHMRSTGDHTFKAAALDFISRHAFPPKEM